MMDCEAMCSLQSQLSVKLKMKLESKLTLTETVDKDIGIFKSDFDSLTDVNRIQHCNKSKQTFTKAIFVRSVFDSKNCLIPKITNISCKRTSSETSLQVKPRGVDKQHALQPSYFHWDKGSITQQKKNAEGGKVESPFKRKHKSCKRYTCDFPNCQFSAQTSTHYKKHITAHTEKRPYHCYICGLGFNESWRLKSHFSAHDDIIVTDGDRLIDELTHNYQTVKNENTQNSNDLSTEIFVDKEIRISQYLLKFEELLSDDDYFDDSQ